MFDGYMGGRSLGYLKWIIDHRSWMCMCMWRMCVDGGLWLD
jgi:hypothetical protein